MYCSKIKEKIEPISNKMRAKIDFVCNKVGVIERELRSMDLQKAAWSG